MVKILKAAALLLCVAVAACSSPPPPPLPKTPIPACFSLEAAKSVMEASFEIDGAKGTISLQQSTVGDDPSCPRHFWAQATFSTIEEGKNTDFMVTLQSGDRQEGLKASALQEIAVRRVVVIDVPYIAGSIEPEPAMKACLETPDYASQCTKVFTYQP